MKKRLLLGSAAMLALAAYTSPGARADVTLTATIDATKDITVAETITITKYVTLNAFVDQEAEKAAEALSLVNQLNTENQFCTNCAEKTDTITGSFSDNSGLLTWNQSSGNMNNQGNAISASVDFEGEPGPGPQPDPGGRYGFAEAQSTVDQRNLANVVDSVNLLFRDALIEDSINDNSGVVLINQSPGNGNNQSNSLALAVSFEDEGTALSEADLGQVNTNQTVGESRRTPESETGITKTATMTGSINGNSGYVGVNQAAGNLANQSNVFAISLVQG